MDYKILPSPPVPHTQALSSESFRPPPLDGSLTLPEMYDWNLEHNPDHPIFAYTDTVEHIIPWRKAVHSVYKLANEIRRRVGREANTANGAPTVVAILSAADTISYYLNIVGIFRAGYTVFPISPRNSPAAVAHLLRKVDVSHILVGGEEALQTLCSDSLGLLGDKFPSSVKTSALPTFGEIYNDAEESSEIAPTVNYNLDGTALILHSSGSTAFPKPIYWTHYRVIQLSWIPYFGERDMCGIRFACHSMPMYHGMGAMQTGWTATSGIIITSFPPRTPAILPSPDNVIESSIDSKSDIIFCVPSFVEAWSRNKDYVSILRNIHGILYGGGPLNQEVGDYLSNEGVSIFISYGCSEVGMMSPIISKPVKKDWNYFRISNNIKSKFRPDGHGHYELVVLPNPYEVPCVFNTKEDGVDAYATSDLLTPHPTKTGYWKIHGRVDDQIMHSTGEKTNPGPLETILNQDPHIRSSVMFGRGRFNAGVIIDPKPEFAFDPADTKALSEFRQAIWPTVQEMNEFAPQHSRIFKEMILVQSPSKTFTYTAKNTARRQAIIDDYASEIDALYAAVQESTQSDLPLPPSWSLPDALDFTRKAVRNVLKHSIEDNADFFRHGCDSLQAMWIRNTLLNALQSSTSIHTRSVPVNFVYHNPSIASLAAYISRLAEVRDDSVQQDDTRRKAEAMEAMVLKYSKAFKPHVPTSPAPPKDTVLVTGTTGGLGSLLLVGLLESSDIERVYALNRNGEELLSRQSTALKVRGVDPAILKSPKLVLLETNLEEDNLGLDAHIYEDIRKSVTHIIHNAYPVNFNLALSSFEPNIIGLRRLIDLSLSSPFPDPPRILFMSSISVVRRTFGNTPVPEKDVDATAAIGVGYSESKWVCEKLLEVASAQAPLRPIAIRIGQLSGMKKGGYWNPKEWVPALFKSSIHVGFLPKLDKVISWIPVDIAAEAVIEMRNSPVRVLHLAHPHPVLWSSIFEPAAQELSIPQISYDDWLHAIGTNDSILDATSTSKALNENPALQIIDFFQSSFNKADDSESLEAMGLKRLALDEALKVSSALRCCHPLSYTDARDWLVSWRNVGFLVA